MAEEHLPQMISYAELSDVLHRHSPVLVSRNESQIQAMRYLFTMGGSRRLVYRRIKMHAVNSAPFRLSFSPEDIYFTFKERNPP